MGAYVSIPGCKEHYNIDVDCSYIINNTNRSIGGHGFKSVPTDADVAGVGVSFSMGRLCKLDTQLTRLDYLGVYRGDIVCFDIKYD
jgi:penicillin-binding protein-related factor A (putative recombinase)